MAVRASRLRGGSASSHCHKASHKINPRYVGATLTLQTMPGAIPRIGAMDTEPIPRTEEDQMMSENSIKQFMETARHYLFGLMPSEPLLAAVPSRIDR